MASESISQGPEGAKGRGNVVAIKDRARKRKAIIADPQAERAVLGSIMINPEALEKVVTIGLQPGDFYEPKHEAIFSAMIDVAASGALDIVTLDSHLADARALDRDLYLYTHTLDKEVPTSLNAVEYAQRVILKALERETMTVGNELVMYEMSRQEAMARLQLVEERRLELSAPKDIIPGTLLADIERQPVNWLWTGRFARGKLAIIDGDPGQGKGFMTLDLAARVTRGRPMPDSTLRGTPQTVILMTPEDDAADTIRPRLEAAQADLSRVRMLTTTSEPDPATGKPRERYLTLPRDILLVEAAVMAEKAALLIIDPIMAMLDAGVKTANDQEVRAALMPLKAMAERTGVAVVLVRHFNKGGGDNALYRGGGSIAFTGLCRTTFLVAAHPDGGDKRVLAHVKSNISKTSPSLSFSLISNPPDSMPFVAWDRDACEYDARELLSARKSDERREIVRILAEQAPLTPLEISEILGVSVAAIKMRLSRMLKAGEVSQPGKGLYALPITPVTTVIDVTSVIGVTDVTTS